MAVAIDRAFSRAWKRMLKICFQPFQLGKWFVVGFCAWLAYLGEGLMGQLLQQVQRIPEFIEPLKEFADWYLANQPWSTVLVLGGVFLFLLLMVILTAVRCRGKFMFLDALAHNRGAVVEPWKKHAEPAYRLFWFIGLLDGAYLLALALLGGVCVLIAWPDIVGETFGSPAVLALVLGIFLFLPLMLIHMVLAIWLEHFVIPLMYTTGKGVFDSWRIFFREVLSGKVGWMLLYFLILIGLGIAMGMVTCVATCVTCCLVALPYLGTVILLPMFVFMRAFSLTMLEEFAPQYAILVEEAPPGGTLPPLIPVPDEPTAPLE